MALSVKIPFAGLFRGLFRSADKTSAVVPPSVAKKYSAVPTSVISAASALTGKNNFLTAENTIEIPLASVVSHLPMELRAKIMSAPAASATLCLAADTIVSQLATGTVKISFGELRRLAPNLIANSGGEHDSRTVNLPLPEILAHLNPALLVRRSGKKITVAEEITGPFAERGRGVNFTATPLKAPSALMAPPTATVAPTPSFEAPPLTPSAPITFAPRALDPTPAPLPPSRFPTPTAATPDQFLEPKKAPPMSGLRVALASLAENWPVDLRNEISQSSFAAAAVTLPEALIEAGLKRGRVTMTWKQIRTLAAAHSPVSENDDLELQLPLKIIAPLFLTLKKNNFPTATKVQVSSEIPDLFFGFPQPSAPPVVPGLPPLPKPSANLQDTNYFVPGAQNQTGATENAPTDFSSRQATPKEVVARALALPGVAGAVVALPDGLRVASEVPAELNADTLAAFLPQIFERVNQSTRELRLGALNNVSFTVGNVPWKIFRVNSVYFATFGRAGEALPTAQLAQLAAEIDRKK